MGPVLDYYQHTANTQEAMQMQAPVKGFKPNPNKKRGGKITGPGTGTSDSIQKPVEDGSYIMPADSTEQIGEQNLEQLGTSTGQPVDVQVSNGEYELPPEQVHAIGAQALDQMRAQTHMPADTDPAMGGYGFHPDMNDPDRDMPELPKFANGGLVTEEDAARMRKADGNVRPSQSRAVVPYTERPPATTSQPAASPAASPQQPQMARPEVQTSLDQATKDRLQRARDMDRFKYEAEQKTAAAKQAEAASAFQKQQNRGFLGRQWDKIGGARGLLRTGGAASLAIPGLINAARDDIDEQYAKRFGWEDTYNSGKMGPGQYAAMRGLGFATDVGSAVTLGAADYLYRDKQGINPDLTGTLGGALAGGWAGNKGNIAGAAIDKGLGVVTRGGYKGNLAQQVLGNKGSRFLGTVAGAGVGGHFGPQVLEAVLPDSAIRQPTTEQQASAPAPAQQPVEGVADNAVAPEVNQPATAVAQPGREAYASGILKPDMVDGVPTFTQEHVKGFNPKNVNTISSEAMSSIDPSMRAQLAQARADAVARGEPVPGIGGFQGGTRFSVVGDSGRAEEERRKAFKAASTPYEGAQNGQLTSAQINAMRGLINDDKVDVRSAERNATDAARVGMEGNRLGNDTQRLQLEQRKQMLDEVSKMPEIQQAQIRTNLLQRYQSSIEAGDQESAKAVSDILKELNSATSAGSENLKNNFMTVGGGQEWNEQAGVMRNVPQRLVDLRTGQEVGGVQQQQQWPIPPENHIRGLKKNSKSATEIANFESIYGPGSAARYLN